MLFSGVGMVAMNEFRDGRGRFASMFEPGHGGSCPHDFEAVFVSIGRLECEEHYHVGRSTVTRWLEECGKERLIAERWAFVVRDRTERAEKRRGLSRKDMGRIFAMAFPLERPNLSGEAWSAVDCERP